MINRMTITTSLLLCLILNQFYAYSQPAVFVPIHTEECPNDFATTCDLQCPDGNYVRDAKGCPTCACASNEPIDYIDIPSLPCPEVKCRANCGDDGYESDENGCKTCKCKSKSTVQCTRVMCRMFCENGFKRDENGCEYCACNEAPQPCPPLSCDKTCSNGFRKDYSGCPTCECNEPQPQVDTRCSSLNCDLDCKYGLQRNALSCPICACNRCPLTICRMFCTYGFLRDNDGCEVCECDWTPIAENIQCSERFPCPGTRVCNLAIQKCETVDPDKINWFLYDFEVETDLFNDPKFVETFKNGLIHNIAAKYGLAITQITVSSVERHGLTSFQIMPFYREDMDVFDKKMDLIDIDLNSREFRAVLPAVAREIEDGKGKNSPDTKWKVFALFRNPRYITYIIGCLLGIALLIFGIGIIRLYFRHDEYTNRSESKSPIYDASYMQAPSDDDHYRSIHAPDGTTYVIVETDDPKISNDKQVLV